MCSSRGSSWPRDRTPMSLTSHALAGRFFITSTTGKPYIYIYIYIYRPSFSNCWFNTLTGVHVYLCVCVCVCVCVCRQRDRERIFRLKRVEMTSHHLKLCEKQDLRHFKSLYKLVFLHPIYFLCYDWTVTVSLFKKRKKENLIPGLSKAY